MKLKSFTLLILSTAVLYTSFASASDHKNLNSRSPNSEQNQNGSNFDFASYLQLLTQNLNQMVLGQPEGVETLIDIEKQNILTNQQRSVPEVAMFIGLPGTGKDTLVESYIQSRFTARYDQPNVDITQHIFRYPVVKSEKDVWTLTGSGTGYAGSDKLSALIRFLILHSGGKYLIQNEEKPFGGKGPEYVVENPDWRPGQVLEGYFAPEDGALFVNEFHDWSKQLKNDLIKEALEKGYFTIGNPGEGINRIQVPINIFLASNNGIGLITARDRDGKRTGAPLDESQLMERWKLNAGNKSLLKEEIANASTGNPDGGTTEEVLSRIPNSRLILLRPLSKENLLKIVSLKLKKVQNKFSSDKSMGFPALKLTFSEKLLEFLATYDQISEEGARSVDDKIKTLIEKPLMDALFSKSLIVKSGTALNLDVRANKDGTHSLLANKKPVLISYTEKGRNSQPISNDEIDKLNQLEIELNKRVKGVPNIVHQLAKDIRRSSNTEKASHPDLETKTADVYMFLGTSSTGKTELAVALHQVLYATASKPLVVDFSQIQTVDDLKSKILGSRDSMNKSIPSDFMQEYDRSNGKLVVVFDEISNANPEVLKTLYDLMREPVVYTFSDKKARPMGQVKIVMTGNAGEEWYKGIPREAPESEQLEAARKIYDSALENEGYLRKFLMTKFSEAFVNRVGLHRIFFFAPHTSNTVRELIQLKLVKAIQEFSNPRPGKRTWNLKFKSAQDYIKTIESIENYGFKLWEQGASIANFIQQVLIAEIHDQLLINKVPDKSEVVIVKAEDKMGSDSTKVGFQLFIKGRKNPLDIEVKGKAIPKKMRQNPKETLLTAFHEAGHEVVNHVLLGDKIKPAGLSILPGVTEINGQWIAYEGVARHEQVESYQFTREMVIAQIAVLAGGEAAEQLTTKNSRHTAGKSNDLQRATRLARTAILKWGLSDKWGRTSLGEDQSIDQFLSGLSAAKRSLFEKEVQSFIEEGRSVARKVIIANYQHLFNPIAQHLASQGEISGPVLQRFYQQRDHLIVHLDEADKINNSVQTFEAKARAETPSQNARDFEFYSFSSQPKSIINIDQLREEKRAKELASVDLSAGSAVTVVANEQSVVKKSEAQDSGKKVSIQDLVTPKGGKSSQTIQCSKLLSLLN